MSGHRSLKFKVPKYAWQIPANQTIYLVKIKYKNTLVLNKLSHSFIKFTLGVHNMQYMCIGYNYTCIVNAASLRAYCARVNPIAHDAEPPWAIPRVTLA